MSTTDPKLKSWVETANDPECGFPVQHLPYCVFSRRSELPDHHAEPPVIGVGIGDQVLDLAMLHDEDFFAGTCFDSDNIFDYHCLNELLWYGKDAWDEARARISDILRADGTMAAKLRDHEELRRRVFVPMEEADLYLPVDIGDYTDFYASREHASNVGSMFRDASNPLLPNWKHIPVGYHGRASSIVPSEHPIIRPCGQTKADDADAPIFEPCRLLDFELEVGFFTGEANEMGERLPIDEAADHIFGLVLLNDWSARDIQKWEYVPLGPFLAKNFATSIGVWVTPLAALEPYRVRTPRREDDPPVLPYLDGAWEWGLDLRLEVLLSSAKMRAEGLEPMPICRNSFELMYWNICQQLTHHAATGCPIRAGDLCGSGTVSGTTPDSRGSMLEITWRGTEPLKLPTGEERKFLADGDEVIMRGHCGGEGRPRIELGEVRGIVQPAILD